MKMKNRIQLSRLVVVAVAVMALPIAAKAQDEQGVQIRGLTKIDTTVRLDRGGAVDLSLISGKIRVTGWDRPDVKISASIESGLLRFNANSSRVSLSVDDSDEGGRRGRRHNNVGDARYDVSVPRGTRLILEAVSGDVTAKGSQGEIEATSVSGDVDVTDGVRAVSAEAVSGSVHAAQVNGNLRTETVSGDLRAENVTGRRRGELGERQHPPRGNSVEGRAHGNRERRHHVHGNDRAVGPVQLRIPLGDAEAQHSAWRGSAVQRGDFQRRSAVGFPRYDSQAEPEKGRSNRVYDR